MNGIGAIANQAMLGATTKKAPLMITTDVSTCRISLAPRSRKRSSWFTSSLSTDSRPPVERSSK